MNQIALLIGLLVVWTRAIGQDATLFKGGVATQTKVNATSANQIFTTHGNFNISEIDSIHTESASLRELLTKRNIAPTTSIEYKSANNLYVDDMPINEVGQLVYTEVIQSNGSAADLYLKAKEFFAKTFKSANDVIQLDDKETGTILGKGFSEVSIPTGLSQVSSRIYYTIKIQCKDTRYKYEITNLYARSYPTQYISSSDYPVEGYLLKSVYYKKNGKPKVVYAGWKNEIERVTSDLILLIKATMRAPVKKDEW